MRVFCERSYKRAGAIHASASNPGPDPRIRPATPVRIRRDLWRATQSGGGFANPVAEPNLSSDQSDGTPVLSHDRLTIYFQSSRPGAGAMGSYDVWRSRRSTVNDGFPAPTPVTELNSAGADWPGWLSPDGCRLYLASDRSGTFAIYLAER